MNNTAVLISIKPRWCELIASGEKTIEVRKTRPKLATPFKCYIYCTSKYDKRHGDGCFQGRSCGKVIGEFVCDYIYRNMSFDYEVSYVSASELKAYSAGKPLYGWHIADLVIYDEPRELAEFASGSSRLEIKDDNGSIGWSGMKRPPQSWCYVEEIQADE